MVARQAGFTPEHMPVVVEPGQIVEQDFLLSPSAQHGEIAGQVFGMTPDGQQVPLAGAAITLCCEYDALGEIRSNDEGWYQIGMVRPGTYVLSAHAEGYVPEDAPVTVEPGQVLEQNFVLWPVD
jgi:hypothetical protein